jgi:hypothetical protein
MTWLVSQVRELASISELEIYAINSQAAGRATHNRQVLSKVLDKKR